MTDHPDAAQWTRWQGGEMPLPEGASVEVILRYGKQVVAHAGSGYATRWSYDSKYGDHDDIVFYRIHSPAPETHLVGTGKPVAWKWEGVSGMTGLMWDEPKRDGGIKITPLYDHSNPSPSPNLDGVYVIPREMTDEEWSEVKYNVDRKADPDIPLWRIREAVKYANHIAGHRGRKMIETPSPSTNLVVTDELATTYKAAFRAVFDRWLNDEGGIPQENIGLIATKAGLQAVFDALAAEGQADE